MTIALINRVFAREVADALADGADETLKRPRRLGQPFSARRRPSRGIRDGFWCCWRLTR